MHTRHYLLALAVWVFSFFGQASTNAPDKQEHSPIVYGFQQEIDSKSLQGRVQLNVYLPDDYSQSDVHYPVLYVLDGQWHFTNAIGIQKSLKVPDLLPAMIVIGVVSDWPIRSSWYGNQADDFHQFLQSELVPFVDATYRTNSDNVLFGWENGAFFASYALTKPDTPFNGFIASNGGGAEVAQIIGALNSEQIKDDKYLYMVNSDRDVYTVRYSDRFAKALESASVPKLIWAYEKFNDETHESMPFLGMYKGLKYYFHNYNDLFFSSIDDFLARGGIPYLQKYFKLRGERFDLPGNISNATKDHLIWLAWNHNNFDYFKLFMGEFKDVLTTQRYDSAYWQNRFGRFYLQHGDLLTAKGYFERAIVKYPDTVLLHEGLSKVLSALKRPEEAKLQLSKAIEIAEANSDPDLKKLRKAMSEL